MRSSFGLTAFFLSPQVLFLRIGSFVGVRILIGSFVILLNAFSPLMRLQVYPTADRWHPNFGLTAFILYSSAFRSFVDVEAGLHTTCGSISSPFPSTGINRTEIGSGYVRVQRTSIRSTGSIGWKSDCLYRSDQRTSIRPTRCTQTVGPEDT